MSSIHLVTPEELKNLRKKYGLTQNQLAIKAGVSQSLIARIENKTVDPRLSTIRKIVNAIFMIQNDIKKAKDVMHSPVITITQLNTIRQAIFLMKKNAISQLPVVRDKKIIGSIQESTLLNMLSNTRDLDKFFSNKVKNVMEKPFIIIDPNTDVQFIINLLSKESPAVLVVEQNKIVGIITKIDILLPSSHINLIGNK